MKYLLLFNDHILIRPSGAAYSRMLNYAKALTVNKDITVIFCSFKHNKNLDKLFKIGNNIFYLGEPCQTHRNIFFRHINKILYPIKTIVYLFKLKRILK